MTSARLDQASPDPRRPGWGPILAGALLGLTLATALSLAGAGIGASLIDPFGAPGPLVRGLDTGALVWLVFINIAGLLLGVLIAMRLQRTVGMIAIERAPFAPLAYTPTRRRFPRARRGRDTISRP